MGADYRHTGREIHDVTCPWLKPIEDEFQERLAGERLAHAFLLQGPEDVGKQALATEFIASMLCLENSFPACGECRSCSLLESGAHPDRHILTFEEHPKKDELRKEIVIEQVRRLIASLQLTRSLSPRKAALICPAEAMTISAANALLKTLEEPPGDSVLILVSHNPARLPATIRSRCQNLNVRPPEASVSLEWLGKQCNAAPDDAAIALEAAAGSPLRALRMLEDGSTDQYRLVSENLEGLRRRKFPAARAMTALADVDPALLWSWISLRAAAEVRAAVHSPSVFSGLSRLQSEADRNRGLVRTPVRNDLLLQDWLIQWSQLND